MTQTNKTQTIAGVKVTDKAAKQVKVVNAIIVVAINAFVYANGGWTQAFQTSAQSSQAPITQVR